MNPATPPPTPHTQLTCELNGKKYLLAELPVFDGDDLCRLHEQCNKLDAVYQGIAHMELGELIKKGFMIVKILVPEERISELNSMLFGKESKQRKITTPFQAWNNFVWGTLFSDNDSNTSKK